MPRSRLPDPLPLSHTERAAQLLEAQAAGIRAAGVDDWREAVRAGHLALALLIEDPQFLAANPEQLNCILLVAADLVERAGTPEAAYLQRRALAARSAAAGGLH